MGPWVLRMCTAIESYGKRHVRHQDGGQSSLTTPCLNRAAKVSRDITANKSREIPFYHIFKKITVGFNLIKSLANSCS